MTPSDLILPAVAYACLNILAFGVYALDKHKARAGRWRIPETTLLLLAALGPFGALAAMQVFRHKTRHLKFWLVPVFAFIHGILILWLVSSSVM